MRRKRTHPGALPCRDRYRAQVIHPITGERVSANKVLGLKNATYATKTEASDVCKLADEKLANLTSSGNITVAALRERWLESRDWAKESTRITNDRRTRRFCDRHADEPAAYIEESDWIEFRRHEGGTNYHLEGLKTMFNWGASSDGGRVIPSNPFRDLSVSKKNKGNARKNPPTTEEVDRVIAVAYEIWPSFGAWLEFACYTGARPGEIDGLRWGDFKREGDYLEARVRRQWNAAADTFTLPKNGVERVIVANKRAEHAIGRARQHSDSSDPSAPVFVNRNGEHFRAAARNGLWSTIAGKVSWERERPTLYLTTRHFYGWFHLNVLRCRAEDIAAALGHTDGGELVRKLYGHLDEGDARKRVAAALAEQEARERAERKAKLRKIDGGKDARA